MDGGALGRWRETGTLGLEVMLEPSKHETIIDSIMNLGTLI